MSSLRLRAPLARRIACGAAALALAGSAALHARPQGERDAVRRRAVDALQAGELDLAETACAEWLATHPRDWPTLVLLGRVLVARARRAAAAGDAEVRSRALAGARDALEAAEPLAGDRPLPYVERALSWILLAGGRPLAAIERLDGALAEAPEHPGLRRLRGQAALQLGRHDEAEADLARAVAAAPRDVGARLMHAEALFGLGRGADARMSLREGLAAIEDEPPDRRHWQILHSLARYVGNDLGEARESLERAARMRPDHLPGRLELGVVLYRLGDRKAAAATLEPLLAAAEAAARLRASAAHHLALIAQHAGRHTDALRRFEQALALDPDRADALRGYGAALRRLGREEEARRALSRLPELIATQGEISRLYTRLFLAPSDRGARERLIELLSTAGRAEEAREQLDLMWRGVEQGEPEGGGG